MTAQFEGVFMQVRRLRGFVAVVVALLTTAVLAGCSGDGDTPDESSAAASVSADTFCEEFADAGGTEVSIRPVPASLTVDQIRTAVERGRQAMDGVTPATEIKASWEALSAHYTSVAGQLEQSPPKGRLPKAQRRQLQQQSEEAFNQHGRAVVNYILRHCV